MNPKLAAALLTLGMAGCTNYPGDYPSNLGNTPLVSGQVAPMAIPPGAAVDVAYSVQSNRPVTGVTVIGLPANSLAAGTNANLTVPYTNGQVTHHTLAVQSPASAGAYPLQIRVAYADGTTTMHPIGTLTVADVPGIIEGAAIEPAGHTVGASCTGPAMTANLRYTVADANGAGDVVNPMLTMPAFPTAYTPAVPILAPVSAVTSVTPSGTVITQPVVVQAVPVAYPTLQPVSVALAAPNAANAVRQNVVTPINIACQLPAGNWTWQIQAMDVDQITGAQRILGPVPVMYMTR